MIVICALRALATADCYSIGLVFQNSLETLFVGNCLEKTISFPTEMHFNPFSRRRAASPSRMDSFSNKVVVSSRRNNKLLALAIALQLTSSVLCFLLRS
eukprot:5691288-Pleurochrysis_carterae.AAC.2